MFLNFIVLGLVPGTDLQISYEWTLAIAAVFSVFAVLILSSPVISRRIKAIRQHKPTVAATA